MTEAAYTVEPTQVYRDHWKKWQAKTAVVFPELIPDDMFPTRTGRRALNLRTYRTDRGLLVTTASVCVRSDGMETTALFQDYSKTVLTASPTLGRFLARLKLCALPEEIAQPAILKALDATIAQRARHDAPTNPTPARIPA